MDFSLDFQGKIGNNSIYRRVMSMEIVMQMLQESFKPECHGWTERLETALSQAVIYMRDNTSRI
jgi:hypothetical protein